MSIMEHDWNACWMCLGAPQTSMCFRKTAGLSLDKILVSTLGCASSNVILQSLSPQLQLLSPRLWDCRWYGYGSILARKTSLVSYGMLTMVQGTHSHIIKIVHFPDWAPITFWQPVLRKMSARKPSLASWLYNDKRCDWHEVDPCGCALPISSASLL